MVVLRPYQTQAKQALYEYLRQFDDNPCVVIPTAGGKSPLMASVCQDAVNLWQGRVLILAHVKELLEQTADKLRAVCPEVKFGVYSAGLKRRETDASVIIAGIQSVYKRACELGAFDLILVDESHLLPLEGEGMYRQFLADAKVINPNVRVVGFTATPFRLKSGLICTPDGILNRVCYEVTVKELVRDGYLCPLVSRAGTVKADTTNLHVRGGEFAEGELEALMDQDALVQAACREIAELTADRRSIILFASGVQHGQHIQATLRSLGRDCGFIHGKTPDTERAALIEQFKSGALKYLCNVNVLTTGFDAPNIDCVVMLRPTLSAGLFYQMVGRGFRLHPAKQNCLVLDFAGNVLRHGPVDELRVKEPGQGTGDAPVKECPGCNSLIATGFAVCPQCGYLFPPPQRAKHEARPVDADVMATKVSLSEHRVQDVMYRLHRKRGAGDETPATLRVDYRVSLSEFKSEWVCLEHSGYARLKAERWWRERSPDPVPSSVERALEIAEAGGLRPTLAIKVRSISGDKFDRVVGYEFGSMPEPVIAVPHVDLSGVPF